MAGINKIRRAKAEWFAELWHRLNLDTGKGVHLRRLHYSLVSRGNVEMSGGMPYTNTDKCWVQLGYAARDARYLRLVPAESFVDKRSSKPVINLQEPSRGIVTVDQKFRAIGLAELPPPPELILEYRPKIPQYYHVEVWVEKTTMNDVLKPLSQIYKFNLVEAEVEHSLTRCDELVQRARDSGRPTRILFVSDFDPRGFISMPVAAARKIEHRLRTDNLQLDIQLRHVVLNPVQVQQYDLPRTPIKESEKMAPAFEQRFGVGATELDALEALHPGVLRRIMRTELDRYIDPDFDQLLSEDIDRFEQWLSDSSQQVVNRYASERARNQAQYNKLRKRCDKELREILRERASLDDKIKRELELIDTEKVWAEPEPGDDDADALYDSSRSYLDQVDRFKLHQDKSTRRKGT